MLYVLTYQYYDGFHDIDNLCLFIKEFNTLKELRECVDYIRGYNKHIDFFCCKVLKDLNTYRFRIYKKSKPYPYMEFVGLKFNKYLSDEYDKYKECKSNAYK